MEPRSRVSRLLVATSAVTFAAIVAGYLLVPDDRWARAWLADIAWTWTTLYAVLCSVYAWRRRDDARERAAWRWIAVGCGSFLLGQLIWSYYELGLRARPAYPSLADVGFLGFFPAMLVAVATLWRTHPRRPLDVEGMIDTLLVTFAVGALAYEFLLEPLARSGASPLALATSTAWAVGGVAVLWMILVQMIYRPQFPLGGAGFVLVGLITLGVTNVFYAADALSGTFVSGGVLDLGWDAGFLLVAAAAAVAPERDAETTPVRADTPGLAPRTIALAIGLGAVTLLAVAGALRPDPEIDLAVLAVLGLTIVTVRVLYSLSSDRRYSTMLEREVAAQTGTLMDSLSATAAAERNLRLVMEAVPDAILLLDADGRIVEANAPAARMLGLPEDTTPGHSVFEFLETEGARIVRDNLAAAFAGEIRRFEVPFVRTNRTRGMSSVMYAPVREGGHVRRVLALSRDVTDLRRAEAQLAQAEKLAAMGQLVSGVAHEINNPAAIISGFAQTLLLDDLPPEHHEMIQMIHDEATRIGRITSNLLAFARAGGRDRALVDVNDIARRTFALRSYHLSTLNIAVTLQLDPTEPKVWGNGSELQQTLLNLLINAEQALVTVDSERAITLRTASGERDVTIECVDTGPGIPAEIRDRIFDPFFTTKPEGVGTGLGLSICYGIVHDHSGRIAVESEIGRGATFSVVLPRDPRTHQRAPLERPASAPPEGSPVAVLLVDDEAGLRAAVARFLTRRGMECRAVGDGAEALEVLRHHDFDVILSDVRMPGMNGREFLARLRAERPELVSRLVFSTGDTYAPETATLLKDSGVPSLVKPFDFTELEAVIRDVVARVSA